MKHLIVLLALLFGGIVMPTGGPATATDLGTTAPGYSHRQASVLPFPRNARADAVWGEAACWRDCQASCTWGLAGCLSVDTQGRCVKYADTCDRSCQRECRARGGPYLPIDD